MGTFNERAEKLMDKLSDVADNKTEANMLHLVNCVTLDVIAKVLCQSLFCSFLCSSLDQIFFFLKCDKSTSLSQQFIWSSCNYLSVYACFLDNPQVAFGVDLDLQKSSSPFPKAIETCLKGMLYNVRDFFFAVRLRCKFVWSAYGENVGNCVRS